MIKYSVFDILGPIMIGPSSSHTAGAARLAKVAKLIALEGRASDETVVSEVIFYLHGSFATTYQGHGSDRALVAGMLGFDPWDERLKRSFELALTEKLQYSFVAIDLGDVHPNTIKFVIKRSDGVSVVVVGSSIGGGKILITSVDGEELEFSGDFPTLILKHHDRPGIVSKVSALLYDENINIAYMKVFRQQRGEDATMVFETDSIISDEVLEKLKELKRQGFLTSVKRISPIALGA
ncbi:MAG: L-serine ammonia-lyase, iron-sulfur-dependent, subunit beta [Oligoflexia bacterium]|nr:L-serine ammonia-lyase, iron-sulfur-dependent, subunit beta [Oligoflexia bacterium]